MSDATVSVEVLPGHHVYDGSKKKHMPGEKLNVTPKDAERLVRLGVVKAAKSAPAGGGAAGGGQEPKLLTAAETIKLVEAAATIKELDKLAEGEERKTVKDAIEKRRAELAEPK